ncbi:hypothetical protein CO116_01665 [Candidatus Falkowbacteria bacterium CG_4_9_14_3_um_filter_38_19]|uniref:Gcp-like domain-containing protein n=2 Tax=Candidatus Falkowiibacteriota TaxID=1752728 RepID=A0A2M6WQD2_9BACT|nr:hypothetical protein [Candidatus Falkowbacteria bacterium]PIT95011.1 MAG: hypothetical protein COT96_02180 [Candidatus Falkowbacteria bacterium CG10_big_fil_rev_8_21_14_0_10_38_22]PJB16924.1 MAG: hypothetical protein CO116_01665 [Candidatus Falkowbacteria bacterium CG_4_9_14_3_um_filter_38_19]
MILYINTTDNDNVQIALKSKREIIVEKKFKAKYRQAEKLLPAISKLLKINKINLKDLQKIKVENREGSFTSLRIGVVTANALGYALGVPVEGGTGKAKVVKSERGRQFNVVIPKYNYKPNITMKKSNK